MRGIGAVLRDAWALARPYWSSEERWSARGLLAVVVLLNLALVGMNVILTFWQRAFYNALENKDWDSFVGLLFLGRTDAEDGFLPGFCLVAGLFIVVAVAALYLRQLLEIRWRRWLTTRMVGQWLHGRAHYQMSLVADAADNPDQRISEDVRSFVAENLGLGLGLLSSVVTLLSFVAVLWGLSAAVPVLGLNIPGYLVWVALLYSAAGTWVAHLIGRSLSGLHFQQQRLEADFRYALVRVRDNAEGIALHHGEADEERGLNARFAAVFGNWRRLMTVIKRLTFFTSGFGQVASIFPIVVAAPAFFAGRIPLGGLIQTSSAFGQVQGSLSWFLDSYSRLTEWRATVARLVGFEAAIAAAEAGATAGPRFGPGEAGALALSGVALDLPDGRRLLEGVDLSVAPGEAVLVTGASGSGKSTLFRAIAGVWPFGRGRIAVPRGAQVLFLPQRPYLPLGTLRRALCYPSAPEDFPDDAVRAALAAVGLGFLAPRLDEADSWDRRLSGGEQQRVAFARALLQRPDWLFLDEATASLDPEAEEQLYALLRERLPGTAMVSIAHRPAVARFHDRAVRVAGGRLADAVPAPG